MNYRFARFWFGVVILVLAASCAKEMPPPGGPVDKTPPQIMESIPADGEVEVPVDTKIEVFFTERIDRRSVEGAIFISPLLAEKPLVKVKRSRVIIEAAEPLNSGRTYVLTIGASASDIRRNKMIDSWSIAFSTGSHIDSGALAGIVLNDLKPERAFRIFAYQAGTSLYDSLFQVKPDYVTESGKDGTFEFKYITEGDYLLLGVADKDGDDLINSLAERLAFPEALAHSQHMGAELTQNRLYITDYDSVGVSIISCSGVEGAITLRASGGKLDPKSVYSDSVTISRRDGYQFTPESAVIFENDLTRVHLFSGELNIDSGYTVTITGLRDKQGKSVAQDSNGCFVRIKKRDDQPPVIVARTPQVGTYLVNNADDITLTFSEPVTVARDAATVAIDSSLSVAMISQFQSGTGFSFSTAEASILDSLFQPLTFVLDQRLVSDRYGNPLGDTLTEFQFRIISPDSLGTVEGIIMSDSGRGANITLTGLRHKLSYNFIESSDPFLWTLYPDKYLLSAFLDDNDNGHWDIGSLEPFSFAEPGFAVSDTIRVRARFEQIGYEFDFRTSSEEK